MHSIDCVAFGFQSIDQNRVRTAHDGLFDCRAFVELIVDSWHATVTRKENFLGEKEGKLPLIFDHLHHLHKQTSGRRETTKWTVESGSEQSRCSRMQLYCHLFPSPSCCCYVSSESRLESLLSRLICFLIQRIIISPALSLLRV